MPSLPAPTFQPTRSSAAATRVAFYVPSRTRDGHASHAGVTQADLLSVIINFLTFEFGGATKIRATGFFVHPEDKRTQAEEVDVVYANATPDALAEHMATIEELANDLAVRLDQRSVAFEIGTTMYFAAPTERYREVNSWLLPKLLDAEWERKRGWSRYLDIAPLVKEREKEEARKKKSEAARQRSGRSRRQG